MNYVLSLLIALIFITLCYYFGPILAVSAVVMFSP